MDQSSEPPCTPRHRGFSRPFSTVEPVSDDVLSPGWSSYEWRLRYRSYDVTSLIRPKSVLGIALGQWLVSRAAGLERRQRLLRQ